MSTQRLSPNGNGSPTMHAGYGNTQGTRWTFFGLIQSFVFKLLSAIPFCARLFLRKNIGSMTFSWITLFFAALWVRFILDGTYQLDELSPPETFMYEWFNKGNGPQYFLAVAAWLIIIFFKQFGGVIINFFPSGLADLSFSFSTVLSLMPFFLSLAVIYLGIRRKWQIKRMHDRRIIFDPMSRGESLLYEELLDRIDPKDRNLTLAWLEICTLLLLAFVMYLFSFGNPEWLDYAGFFAIAALGIVIEEWRVQVQKRKEIEVRMANEFKAEELQRMYNQYKGEDRFQPATVTFIAFAFDAGAVLIPQAEMQGGKRLSSPTYPTVGALVNRLPFIIPGVILAAWFFTASGFNNENVTEVGLVQTQNLTLRKRPRLEAQALATLPEGAVLQIIECGLEDNFGREWCKILYNGQSGYSVKSGAEGDHYLWTEDLDLYSITFFDVPFEDIVFTDQGSPLNLRSSPSLTSTALTQIPSGTQVTVLSAAEDPEFLEVGGELIFGSWCRVRYEEEEGYCFSWYLEGCRIPNSQDPWG